jgi:nifR3 family TIM-barrel protein
MKDFWQTLARPIMALAPMEDVTDAAFRRLIATYGKPDVMFTEFTSADGLVLAPEKRQRILRKKLIYSETERPIAAQLFSADPERMEKAAALVQELGFDGIDINMGCPVREVVDTGCGAALIKNPTLARLLMRAARRGAPTLPLSVKTRIGYDKDELDTWLPELLGEVPAAIVIHARTRKEMSDVPAHWDAIARAVKIRDDIQNPRGNTSGMDTLILGNGDVQNLAEARSRVAETGCDGIMLGRAIYGNPWLFSYSRELENNVQSPIPKERIEALIEHLKLFDELLGDITNYATMKKHFKAYISGWDNAKDLRIRLMETQNSNEAQEILASAIIRP